ncbi:MAG TPA: hypothetical protein V6C97_33300 [Oculatellaceae cyanobacterium]
MHRTDTAQDGRAQKTFARNPGSQPATSTKPTQRAARPSPYLSTQRQQHDHKEQKQHIREVDNTSEIDIEDTDNIYNTKENTRENEERDGEKEQEEQYLNADACNNTSGNECMNSNTAPPITSRNSHSSPPSTHATANGSRTRAEFLKVQKRRFHGNTSDEAIDFVKECEEVMEALGGQPEDILPVMPVLLRTNDAKPTQAYHWWLHRDADEKCKGKTWAGFKETFLDIFSDPNQQTKDQLAFNNLDSKAFKRFAEYVSQAILLRDKAYRQTHSSDAPTKSYKNDC